MIPACPFFHVSDGSASKGVQPHTSKVRCESLCWFRGEHLEIPEFGDPKMARTLFSLFDLTDAVKKVNTQRNACVSILTS